MNHSFEAKVRAPWATWLCSDNVRPKVDSYDQLPAHFAWQQESRSSTCAWHTSTCRAFHRHKIPQVYRYSIKTHIGTFISSDIIHIGCCFVSFCSSRRNARRSRWVIIRTAVTLSLMKMNMVTARRKKTRTRYNRVVHAIIWFLNPSRDFDNERGKCEGKMTPLLRLASNTLTVYCIFS